MKSITVRVIGGLGNQLHCYAFGRALAAHHGLPLRLDADSGYWNDPFGREYLLDQFSQLNARKADPRPKSSLARQLWRLSFKLKSNCSKFLPLRMKLVVTEEAPLCYKEDVHRAGYLTSPYFIGYWASFRYYRGIEEELRQELKPPMPDHPSLPGLLEEIVSVRSCFIHWRSYKEDSSLRYPDMDSYYREAVRVVSEKLPDVVFFVFSDDPVEVKRRVCAPGNTMVYVDLPETQGNVQSLTDFYLMYVCDHAIIGNSTFSWWAAWLGDSEAKIVVAPGGVSPWGEDWLPPHWRVVAPKRKE